MIILALIIWFLAGSLSAYIYYKAETENGGELVFYDNFVMVAFVVFGPFGLLFMVLALVLWLATEAINKYFK